MRDRERGRDIGRGRSRLPAEEPDAELDPRTPGSRPEPKADAQPPSHPGVPVCFLLCRKKGDNIYHTQILVRFK